MIKKKKGKYECIDCRVKHDFDITKAKNQIIDYVYTDIEQFHKIRSMFKWCLG